MRLILHLTVSVELRHGRRRGHNIYRARLLAYIASCDKNVAMLHGLLTNYQSGRGCFVSRRFRVTLSDKRLILWNDADLCWLVTTNYSFVRVICNVISSGNSVGSFWCKKGKVFPYSLPYRALGPELIPVYRQSARRWREVNHAIYPAVVLPLLSAGPAVTPVAFTRWRYL